MQLTYERYLDQILGGWIGKSMGGAIGARFEGYKGWIELRPDEMFPSSMPPNDDLDLQVLWLKVLEEKGPALTSDDLAAAWLEGETNTLTVAQATIMGYTVAQATSVETIVGE